MVLVVLLLCHCWFVLVAIALISGGAQGGNVTYDHRSLIINGQHKILFSGSIHYPRSTPQMWPSLIAKAKAGGLDVIQTYVFWSLHEPQLGQFDFSGRNDLVEFIKEIQAQGLYACLRIGPFIEAEWGYGGLPFWLHDVPGIVFRTDNKPYKLHMKRFVTRIVKMMKSERLFASQGGPIVLSQIENEYGNMEKLFQARGSRYVHWAAKMAVGLQTGVPWVMCKQDDAPDPLINSCNGRRCAETFKGPNSPNKPAIWTENWTSFFQTYGQVEQIRSAEDIAFNVALFIAKKGSYVNYYMYHGGTNFGRVASSYVVTSYYDQAPLDEYGLHRQPKWGHLKELHAAIKLSMGPLLSGKQHTVTFGDLLQGYVFKSTSGECAAFLVNSDTTKEATVNFRNSSYELPPRSVSILPDCKVVVFNSAKVTAQHSTRSMEPSKKLDSAEKWGEYREAVPKFDETSTRAYTLLEHMNTTKDASDYLWYTFRFRQDSPDSQSLLSVRSKGHVLHAFVNGVFVGSVHGRYRHRIPQFKNAVQLNAGTNYVSLLSVMVGLPDAGSYLESRSAGLYKVKIENTNGSRDFANHQWGYQVGLFGERSKVYTDNGSKSVQWNSYGSSSDHQPLTWYKTSFDAPPGKDPIALNLGSMGKGEAWVNGHSIGRYWVSFQTYKGTPSQTWYNVPRSFLNSTGNLLVLLEEQKGNPLGISVDVVSTSKVCGHMPDSYPPPVNAWRGLRHHGRRPKVRLRCPFGKIISKILFASYGTPSGDCRKYAIGSCHSSHSTSVMEKDCVGKARCSVPVSATAFGGDPCSGHPKSLLVDAQCS